MFEDLIPELADAARELVLEAGRAGLQPRVTSTRRSHSQQKRLYDRYLAGLSPYPAVPAGQSAHEFGYAFDMISFRLEDVGYTWQTWGGIWGGQRDPVHFEYPGFVPPPELGTFSRARAFVGDILLPGSTVAGLAGMLLEAGFGQSEVTEILQHPVEQIYKAYPWLQWADLLI